ncbi:MAG: T9SS type A sorting domain-containing protein [Bacteroidales bacterium]|nr:T9SS type A sorting domain-containing protein [Bacteroidales bacterium]
MKKYLLIIITLAMMWVVFPAKAQDTLTVMQYNLLYYGNYNSGFAECFETNNNTQHKDECIRTILNHVKPDIFTVCEFGATQALQNDFLRHNLNINGADYWQSDNIINHAEMDIINHIFFDSRKIGLKKHVALRTQPRDTDVYELYLKTPRLAAGDTIKLICIVAHPKAGMGYEASRRALMQVAMDNVNQYYPHDNVLIMGDFNMYGASESGYRLLTQTYSNPDICFMDPVANLGGVGEWNNNNQFTAFHTQSTRSYSDECFSSGGLDDRFDFILMADEIAFSYNHLRYVQGSYHAVGNDGRHFNMSVNQGTNTAVPAEVAEALFDASDHLPVTMKIAVDVKLGLEDHEAQSLYASIAPNPATDLAQVHFFNPAQGQVQFELYSLQGQLVQCAAGVFGEGSQQFELNLQDLPKGFYLLRIAHNSGWRQTVKVVVK